LVAAGGKPSQFRAGVAFDAGGGGERLLARDAGGIGLGRHVADVEQVADVGYCCHESLLRGQRQVRAGLDGSEQGSFPTPRCSST